MLSVQEVVTQIYIVAYYIKWVTTSGHTVVSYYIKWVKTSWTYSSTSLVVRVVPDFSILFRLKRMNATVAWSGAHAIYIRWLLKTCCARMKENNPICDYSRSN